MTKGEIAQKKQYLLLPKCFQLYSIIMLFYIEIFHIFDKMFSKSSAADLLYVGKCYLLSLLCHLIGRKTHGDQFSVICVSFFQSSGLHLCCSVTAFASAVGGCGLA